MQKPHSPHVLRPLPLLAAVCALLAASGETGATSVFFPIQNLEDQTVFQRMIEDKGLAFLGRESFPSLNAGQRGVTPGALLAPGIAAGALFPTGSNTTLGLFFQTNSLGGNPSTPSPGGTLFASGPTDPDHHAWLGPNLFSDSLDFFVDPPNHRGFVHALSFNVSTTGDSGLVLRLFDNENKLLGHHSFDGPPPDRLGVLPAGQSLFRVNLHAPAGFLDIGEVDLHVIPEPVATTAILSLAALLYCHWRKRSRPPSA